MTDVISFRPREGLEAEKQVKEFIAWAKGLTGFDKPDSKLDWGAWGWKPWLGRSCDFVKLGVNSRSTSFDLSKELLDRKIIDFAKAYVLEQQSLKTTKTIQEIVAVRVLEVALLELIGEADITRVNASVYDRAAEVINEHFKPQAAYRLGGQLEKLSEFISRKRLSQNDTAWTNSIKRPNDAHGHVKNKLAAQQKMPSQEALDALAEIWSAKPTDMRDIYVTSNCALLLSSPGRVGELNVLAVDALTYKDNSKGKSELFINWYGQKGYGFADKPVPEVWKDFTVESFRRLREITEEPRKLAKWLEDNPDEFPKHDRCPDVGQDSLLTPEQVLSALCLKVNNNTARGTLKNWLRKSLKVLNKRPGYLKSKSILQEQLDSMYEGYPSKEKTDLPTLTLRKLNTYLREFLLPDCFPYTDESKKMKYQHALNCFFDGQMHAGGQGFVKPFSLQKIDKNMLNNSLSMSSSKTVKVKAEQLNIFWRWGYRGKAHSMTTHQFRHYLNTLAAKGKVGEVERARWSGRLDISQNKVYNHVSDEDRVENARALGLGNQASSLATLTSKHEPILLKDLGVSGDRVAHYTEYGACVHDFAVEPCVKFRDCLTCQKHKCIKGDEEKTRRIRLLRDGLERTLEQATEGVDQEFYGADRWLAYSMDRLEKANALIAILDDPDIEDGAVIACTDNGYSPLVKGLAAQDKLPKSASAQLGSDVPKPSQDLKKLRGLLGK